MSGKSESKMVFSIPDFIPTRNNFEKKSDNSNKTEKSIMFDW
jgi:hypothetical protein